MKTIVVGFDGSHASLVAVDWASRSAAQGPSRVEIVAIGRTLLSDDPLAGACLRQAEFRVRDRAPECEVTSRRVSGTMPMALLEHAEAADLLVVGAHRNGAKHSLLSGRFLQLATGTVVPIVVVPDDWSPSDAAVVVGFSGRDASSRTVEVAAEEAHATSTPLLVVHAWQMPAPRVEGSISFWESPIHLRAVHSKQLRSAALGSAAAHPDVAVGQVLSLGEAAGVLLQRARDASLVVIGGSCRGILAGALRGSVAHELLAQSAVPLCIVPNTHRDEVIAR